MHGLIDREIQRAQVDARRVKNDTLHPGRTQPNPEYSSPVSRGKSHSLLSGYPFTLAFGSGAASAGDWPILSGIPVVN